MTTLLSGKPTRRRFSIDQNHEINVTPFVDAMLVLLIVFMVAAPLATNTLKLDLPRADHGLATPTNLAIVSIDAAGRIYVPTSARLDGPIDLDQLASALAPAGQVRAVRVSVQADQRVRYGRFVAVLNRLQDDGYYNVNLIVTPRPAAPAA